MLVRKRLPEVMHATSRLAYAFLFVAFLGLLVVGAAAPRLLPRAHHLSLIPLVLIALGTSIWPADLARRQRNRYEKKAWWGPEYEWLGSPWLYRCTAGILAAFALAIFVGTDY